MQIETYNEQIDRLIRERQALVVPGRTLPKGAQWLGHDVVGRGSAAKRRLRQIARGTLKSSAD